MFSNVGGSGDIKNAWIRGSKSRRWVQLHRNWGANWQSSVDLRNQALSFRLRLVDAKSLSFYNVVPSSWNFGQTFSSRAQFRQQRKHPLKRPYFQINNHFHFFSYDYLSIITKNSFFFPEKCTRHNSSQQSTNIIILYIYI